MQFKIQVLQNWEGLFFQEQLKIKLQKQLKIISKTIGITNSSKNLQQFQSPPYLLDKYSLAYLIQTNFKAIFIYHPSISQVKIQNIVNSVEFKTFKILKQQFYLITAHKFGATFLAYEQDPSKNHAKYLIFCQQEVNIIQITRLAENSKKDCLYAKQNGITQKLQFYFIKREKQQKNQKLIKRQVSKTQEREKLYQKSH